MYKTYLQIRDFAAELRMTAVGALLRVAVIAATLFAQARPQPGTKLPLDAARGADVSRQRRAGG